VKILLALPAPERGRSPVEGPPPGQRRGHGLVKELRSRRVSQDSDCLTKKSRWPMHAATYVGPGGLLRRGCDSGCGAEPFSRRLQRPLTRLARRNTILVMAGKYDERVRVKTSAQGPAGLRSGRCAAVRHPATGFDLQASYIRNEGSINTRREAGHSVAVWAETNVRLLDKLYRTT